MNDTTLQLLFLTTLPLYFGLGWYARQWTHTRSTLGKLEKQLLDRHDGK